MRTHHDVLVADRAEVAVRAARLERELAAIIDAAALTATDDEHDPDGATIAFERAQLSALLDHARRRLVELDTAVARLLAGTYGTCERCGQAIAAARLEALPAAARCVSCASART